MLCVLAKYAAKSCLLLAPWILPTCTLITGGEVAFKCLKLSWRLLQTTVTVKKPRMKIESIPPWKVDKFYSKTPPVPVQEISLKRKSYKYTIRNGYSVSSFSPLKLELEEVCVNSELSKQAEHKLEEEDIARLVQQNFSSCNCPALSKSCQQKSSSTVDVKQESVEEEILEITKASKTRSTKGNCNEIPMPVLLQKIFSSKSLPRQRPKSGRFWKSERCQFRKIKRDRGCKRSHVKRLQMKEWKK